VFIQQDAGFSFLQYLFLIYRSKLYKPEGISRKKPLSIPQIKRSFQGQVSCLINASG